MKRLHPWCKSTRTGEEIKGRSKVKTSLAKQQTTNATKLILISPIQLNQKIVKKIYWKRVLEQKILRLELSEREKKMSN